MDRERERGSRHVERWGRGECKTYQAIFWPFMIGILRARWYSAYDKRAITKSGASSGRSRCRTGSGGGGYAVSRGNCWPCGSYQLGAAETGW